MTCSYQDTRDGKRQPPFHLISGKITHVVGIGVVRPARVLACVVVGEAGVAVALQTLQRDHPGLAEVVAAMARKRGGVRERRREGQEAHERDDKGTACG